MLFFLIYICLIVRFLLFDWKTWISFYHYNHHHHHSHLHKYHCFYYCHSFVFAVSSLLVLANLPVYNGGIRWGMEVRTAVCIEKRVNGPNKLLGDVFAKSHYRWWYSMLLLLYGMCAIKRHMMTIHTWTKISSQPLYHK